MADDDKEKKEKKKKEFKRGKVKRPMLVYHYGGKPHKSSLDLCWWAARGGHRYFNTLVEIERKRRTEFQEARTRLFPDLDRLETEVKNRREELKEIRTEIKLRNQRARRRTGTPEDRARVAALKKQLKPFNNLLKVMRASYNVHPEMQAAAKNISATAKASVKAARHNADTNWGTYLQMEQATEAAFDCVGLPKFKPWRGEGLVAVQLQHGATVAQLTDAEKGQASLTIHPQTTRRSDRRRATLRMRLDSEGRKPVWASVDFVYHRPIPADAKILWILLKLYRDGTKHRWEVNFVCTRSAGFDRDDRATTGLVGVDFGWRKRADGSLRVAYWAESATKHGELVLPADVFDRAGQAEFLQSEADKVFNRARTELADWLRDRNLPDWLRERTLQLGHWRSGGRLIGVLMAWRAERFTGDEEAFDRLSEWYQVYRRLIDRAAIQRRSLQNARLYLYRQWARDWAKTYGQVNLEDADWRILARAAQAEAPTDHDRYCMRLASPGLLRRIILEAIGKEGVHLVETPGTTRTCHLCGHYNTWEKPKELYQRCQNPLCNQLWDQDYNAALVILGR